MWDHADPMVITEFQDTRHLFHCAGQNYGQCASLIEPAVVYEVGVDIDGFCEHTPGA
jgi:hypothetical protein